MVNRMNYSRTRRNLCYSVRIPDYAIRFRQEIQYGQRYSDVVNYRNAALIDVLISKISYYCILYYIIYCIVYSILYYIIYYYKPYIAFYYKIQYTLIKVTIYDLVFHV